MPATEGSSLTPELHLSGAQSDLGLLTVLQLHLGRQTELTASMSPCIAHRVATPRAKGD